MGADIHEFSKLPSFRTNTGSGRSDYCPGIAVEVSK